MFVMMTALAMAAVQAEPLDPDLACVVDRVPASARAGVLAEAAGGGSGGPAELAIVEAATACAGERSWEPDYTQAVGMIAGGLLLAEEATAHLDRAGIPVGHIDDWFDAQPAEIQIMDQPDEAAIEQLISYLTEQGVPLEDIAGNAEQIGLYVGARMAMERVGAGRLG